jgi:integrase
MSGLMQSRTRVLSTAELSTVWRACDDNAYGAIVKLLILTGQRREEM